MNENHLMKDEIMAQMVRELRLEDVSEETQQATLAGVGENILIRMLTEIFKILPKAKHEEFRAILHSGTAMRVHSYLSSYIVDFPAFMQRIVAEEIAETKKLLTQG
jgi:hypothetical protein